MWINIKFILKFVYAGQGWGGGGVGPLITLAWRTFRPRFMISWILIMWWSLPELRKLLNLFPTFGLRKCDLILSLTLILRQIKLWRTLTESLLTCLIICVAEKAWPRPSVIWRLTSRPRPVILLSNGVYLDRWESELWELEVWDLIWWSVNGEFWTAEG